MYQVSPLFPIFRWDRAKLLKGAEIVRLCDRHGNETVTLRKHVTKYKNVRKWMIIFCKKLRIVALKLLRVNSILITKSINYSYLLFFCTVLAVRCDADIFKLTATAQSIYREVYVLVHEFQILYTHTEWK